MRRDSGGFRMLWGMGFDVDEYQRLDDAIHEAHAGTPADPTHGGEPVVTIWEMAIRGSAVAGPDE